MFHDHITAMCTPFCRQPRPPDKNCFSWDVVSMKKKAPVYLGLLSLLNFLTKFSNL